MGIQGRTKEFNTETRILVFLSSCPLFSCFCRVATVKEMCVSNNEAAVTCIPCTNLHHPYLQPTNARKIGRTEELSALFASYASAHFVTFVVLKEGCFLHLVRLLLLLRYDCRPELQQTLVALKNDINSSFILSSTENKSVCHQEVGRESWVRDDLR
jgi:hypothetical protein